MFNLGYLNLEARGLVERLYWATCAKIRDFCRRLDAVPEELEGLESILSDIYFCNVSVFQSLPDSWAIDQLFPIMPVHRLDERPTRNAVLADITCDSDGKIDHFVSLRETKRTLEVHELHDGEPYYLAAFMVGAYQETLGDLHNLFGDTHVVHIKLHDEGGWWIEETVKGDTAAEVLRYMRYDVTGCRHAQTQRAPREGRRRWPRAGGAAPHDGELNGYTTPNLDYAEPHGSQDIRRLRTVFMSRRQAARRVLFARTNSTAPCGYLRPPRRRWWHRPRSASRQAACFRTTSTRATSRSSPESASWSSGRGRFGAPCAADESAARIHEGATGGLRGLNDRETTWTNLRNIEHWIDRARGRLPSGSRRSP
jgi:hypothetical protein